jgi:hypothetical protein
MWSGSLEEALACDADLALCCAVHFSGENGNISDQAFSSFDFPVYFDGHGFDVADNQSKGCFLKIIPSPWGLDTGIDFDRSFEVKSLCNIHEARNSCGGKEEIPPPSLPKQSGRGRQSAT